VAFKRKESIGVAHYGEDYAASEAVVRRALGGARSRMGRFMLRRPSALLFDPLGYYIHSAVTLDPSNVVRTARGETYLHYSEGIEPTLAAQLDLMDRERVVLADAYGVAAETFPQILHRQYGHKPRADFYQTMAETGYLYRSRSPDCLHALRAGRTLREDIPALFTILGLAAAERISVPVTNSFAAALPYLLGRVGLKLQDIERYPWPDHCGSGRDVRALLDSHATNPQQQTPTRQDSRQHRNPAVEPA
jgi:opine dehydrogenase